MVMKVNESQKSALKKLAEKYGLKLIILFGSFANGANKPGSDFDVAILAKDRSIVKHELDLISAVTRALERDVDLSIINLADPLLKYEIARNCVLLFGNEDDFIDFKVKAAAQYMDNQPFFIQEFNYIKKQLKNL